LPPPAMADDAGDATCVPDWVPELRAGVRADVYPVSPPDARPAELVLDRDTVTAGYAERRPPYEFSSLFDKDTFVSPPDFVKIRAALSQLRKSPPAVPQRVTLPPFPDDPASCAVDSTSGTSASAVTTGGPGSAGPSSGNNNNRKAQFPIQKPSAKSSLEDWFNKLASGGSFSTATLCKSVPLGPAIVRAVGKVLEMMAARSVPTQRAVWYIRIAVLNECVKQIRPDRPAPSPRIFWTRQLCGLLRVDIEAMRSVKLPPSREHFWHYVLDIARWQADEALLDTSALLKRIAASVKSDTGAPGGLASTAAGRVALRAAETFLPEFRASRGAARLLCDALIASVEAAGGPALAASAASAEAATEAATNAIVASAAAASASSSMPVKTAGSVMSVPSPMSSAAITAAGGASPSSVRIPPLVTGSTRPAPVLRVIGILRNIIPVAYPAVESLPARGLRTATEAELAALIDIASVALTSKSIPASQPPTPSPSSQPQTPALYFNPKQSTSQQPLQYTAPLAKNYSTINGRKGHENCRVGPHGASRLLERLPASGDVVGARNALLAAFAADNRGGPRAAVNFLCAWAVRGPMHTSHLAIHIASTMIAAIADTLTPLVNPIQHRRPDTIPIFQAEIWHYVKTLDSLRISGDVEPVQDEYGYFVDPQGASSEDMRIVRFAARLFGIGQFSLPEYLKEISRLVSNSHLSARRHLFYVSAFPEPEDKTVADSRRALLRRGQRVAGKRLGGSGGDKMAVAAVRSNDVESSVEHGTRIKAESKLDVILSTAESIMGINHDDTSLPEQRVLSVVGFLSSSGAQMVAVDWLLRVMQSPEFFVTETLRPRLVQNPAAVCAMVYALDNLAPCVASSGNVQLALKRMTALYLAYEQSDSADVLTAIEATAASYSAMFAPNSGSGNSRWTAWVCQLFSDSSSAIRLMSAFLSGDPDSMDNAPEVVRTVLASSIPPSDIGYDDVGKDVVMTKPDRQLSHNLEDCWGPSPDRDIERMRLITDSSSGLKSLATFVRFAPLDSDTEAAPPSLGPWATANAVLGCVVLPQIKDALLSTSASDSLRLASVISTSLELLSDGMHNHDLCGARPNLVIELLALLAAAALANFSSAAQALADVVAQHWVRAVLLSRAGSAMIRRLRVRIEEGLHMQDALVDNAAVTRIIYNSMSAMFGRPLCGGSAEEPQALDAAVVIRLLGWVEWGVAELLLAVIAPCHIARGDMDKFADVVSIAASDVLFCEQAELLVDLLAQAIPDEELAVVTSSLGESSVRGLAQGIKALVAHVLMEASEGNQVVSQAERETWTAFDSTRSAVMRSLTPYLALNTVVLNGEERHPISAMITMVLDQFAVAVSDLRARGANTPLRPDLSPNGTVFSSAIESRFSLLASLIERQCGYFQQEHEQRDAKDKIDFNAAAKETGEQDLTTTVLAVCDVIVSCSPLLLPSAIHRGLDVLSVAVNAAEAAGIPSLQIAAADLPPMFATGLPPSAVASNRDIHKGSLASSSGTAGNVNSQVAATGQTDDTSAPGRTAVETIISGKSKVCIRGGVECLLAPAEVWFDDQQKARLRLLCNRSAGGSNGASGHTLAIGDATRMQVCAFKLDGSEVDPWYLLEGYGHGPDEEPPILPQSFGVQGPRYGGYSRKSRQRRDGDLPSAISPVIRLKRTYSTYAFMAVR
jgi:Transcription mediator complex subunit Med12